MSHKRCAIGLSLCLLTTGVYQALGCGDYVCLTGEFANRTFVDPATRPSGYVGPLYTFDHVRAAVVASDRVTVWIVDNQRGGLKQFRLMDGAQVMSGIEGENAVISADGRWILSNVEGKLVLWDAKHPAYPKKREIAAYAGRLMGFSHDGSIAWVVIGRNRLSVYKTESGELIRDLRGHRDAINSVAISPDNQFVLSGSGHVHETAPTFAWGSGVLDNTVRKWDTASGTMVDVKEMGERNPVLAVAFDARGMAFANRMPVFGAEGAMLEQSLTTVTTTRDGLYALAVGKTGTAVIYALPR